MNTYNEKRERLIEAINSYLNQENVTIHIIVSTVEEDPSINTIKKLDNPKIDLCISTKREHPGKGPKGIFYQINKAIPLIKYGWMSYASSNDSALKNKLYNEISECIKQQKLVCYSNFYTTDENLSKRRLIKFPDYDYKRHLKGNFVNDCATIKTALLKKFTPFKLEYENSAYWDLWLRIYEKEGNVFCHQKNPAFLYRVSEDSQHIKRKKDKKKKEHNLKIRKFMLSQHKK